MARKLKPTTIVKGTAEAYAKGVMTTGRKQKKIAKDTSMLPAERQLYIDREHRNATDVASQTVHSAIQFAVRKGASERQVKRAYYTGAVKGVVKGAVANMRNRG